MGRQQDVRGDDLQDGRYTTKLLDIVDEGKKRVNVERFYDVERYQLNIIGVMGLPMFLY